MARRDTMELLGWQPQEANPTWWTGRVLFVSLLFLLYGLAFFLLAPYLDADAAMLGVLPVIVAGGLLGVQGGVAAALVASVLNLGLLLAIQPAMRHIWYLWLGGGSLLFLFVGASIGHMRDLGEALERKLKERTEDLDTAKQDILNQQEIEHGLEGFGLFPSLLLRLDAQEQVLFAKAAKGTHWLLHDESMRGRTLPDLLVSLLPTLEHQGLLTLVRQAMQGRFSASYEFSLARPPLAKLCYYEVRVFRASMGGCFVLFLDISARRRQQIEMALLSKGIEQAEDAIEIISSDFSFAYVNPSWERMFGYGLQDARGVEVTKLLQHSKEGEPSDFDFQEVIETISRGRTWRGELIDHRKDGTSLQVEACYSPVFDEEGGVLQCVAVKRDITERKAFEERLWHQALHDSLTSLPNRSLFLERLQRALNRMQRRKEYKFAVLFLDLDRFKQINDSLGHEIGDKLLIEVSHRLCDVVRTVDTVARLGGDEFAILLDEIKLNNDATRAAERILQAFSKTFSLEGHAINTTTSIGIAFASARATHPGDLLRDADTAMYRAKTLGKAQYAVFDQKMHEESMALLRLEEDLHHAIEAGAFKMLFQPVFQLEDQELFGFEAFLRWPHASGVRTPGQFMDVAEESGMSVALGWWVLEHCCAKVAHWRQSDPHQRPLCVLINLSPRQFAHPELPARIRAALEAHQLDASAIKLEITEQSLLRERLQGSSVPVLEQLQEMGIQVYLDDFGTGYSSLSCVHQFPLAALKIDRFFTQQLSEDESQHAIVSSILALSEGLEMDTIAEGIETKEQLEVLRGVGCPLGQGFYFSRLLSCEATTALVQSETPTIDQ